MTFSLPPTQRPGAADRGRIEPREAGFTLLELMVVTIVMAIVAAYAMPTLASVNIAGNETAVLGTLRTIFTAEAQVKVAAVIDSDRNGGGEYGFFQELTGVRDIRIDSDNDGIADAESGRRLRPPAITSAFAEVGATGVVNRAGYLFRIYLPTTDCDWVSEPAPGTPYSGVSAFHAASQWACYAWPESHGQTGRRAFFINQSGRILACDNDQTQYSGAAKPPPPTAVLVPGSSGKMNAPTALDGVGSDGNTWIVVQ